MANQLFNMLGGGMPQMPGPFGNIMNMLDTLEDMMDEATSEKERNAIRRCMEKIRA